jgi:hypothetical protein
MTIAFNPKLILVVDPILMDDCNPRHLLAREHLGLGD